MRRGREQRVPAIRPFGELEARVMDVVWSRSEPASVRDVLDGLHADPPLAYTTVMTVLNNLHRKAVLRRRMDNRAYLYEPVDSREAYGAKLMEAAWNRGGDRTATLMRFLDQLPAEDAELLRRLLRRRRGNQP